MRTEPLSVARRASRRSVDAIAPMIPGFHPRSWKRNVVVFLVYLITALVGLGVLQSVFSS